MKVAHIRLCHSRMFLIQAFPRETQEMVFEAHDRAFCLFGGSCRRGIDDNMTTAVDAVFLGRPEFAVSGHIWAGPAVMGH